MQSAHALAPFDALVTDHGTTKAAIIDLLTDFSLEVTPATAAKHASIGALLPTGTRVYVAYVPGEDHGRVVETAIRLRAEGLVPVPHFPARSLTSQAQLEDYLGRVTGEAGVDEVLVIGGGIDRPVGPYAGTAQLLETGLFERHGIRVIGLAGHPEGERALALPGIAASVAAKLDLARRTPAAVRLVTQFAFEALPVLAWERQLRADGSDLPIHIGVPGPASIKSLLGYARLCGVGNSVRVLTRRGGSLLKLASLSYPDALITALARHRATDPATRIERLHWYPFGGLARTARWLEAIQSGAFTMHDDGQGFTAPID
jgi:methylenetetrahydrofolate reductase (NADPH)